MILHQGILALLLGSALATAATLAAALLGARILLRWEAGSASEAQLALERQTSLVSSLAAHALGFHAFSVPLFVAVADGIHPLFPGAMCATGSLNANPLGWWVLPLKGAGAALAALWVVLDRLDRETDALPLLRPRCALLAALALLVGADLALQYRYFSGLDPAVITSCCGSLFSEQGDTVAADLAALPAGAMRLVFFGHAGLLLAALAFAGLRDSAATRVGLAVVAALFLPVALASIISFISVAYYELPTHHCPFDLLQAGYHRVGYALYGSLFGGVFLAVLPGLLRPLLARPGLRAGLARREGRWIAVAAACIIVFVILSIWPLCGAFSLDAGR